MTPLTALSPLDGRYYKQLAALRDIFSEYGLIHRRVKVEIEWLIALSQEPKVQELPEFKRVSIAELRGLGNNFSVDDAAAVKAIEARTNHDVKAVEYWLKTRMAEDDKLISAKEFVHFGLTSEDVNNLAYALMLKDLRSDVLAPKLLELCSVLRLLVSEHHALPMLSRTHGQTASPTTVGKELANVVARLERQLKQLLAVELLGKCSGAVGNYNAHAIAYPEIEWPTLGKAFVEHLELVFNPYTTQIEPHDFIAEFCDVARRINTILIDFVRDIWGYVALGYFKQAQVSGEVGSSTMPHKINPIDFENAEGNFGLANALLSHFSEKLPISRWQRDLSDSTVLRALGEAFGHMLIALNSLAKGLVKLTPDAAKLDADLSSAWEVLGEAIQTVMRRYGLPEPYEQLKQLTRGSKIDAGAIKAFVETLDLPNDAKQRLLDLTPARYIGLASKLAQTL